MTAANITYASVVAVLAALENLVNVEHAYGFEAATTETATAEIALTVNLFEGNTPDAVALAAVESACDGAIIALEAYTDIVNAPFDFGPAWTAVNNLIEVLEGLA